MAPKVGLDALQLAIKLISGSGVTSLLTEMTIESIKSSQKKVTEEADIEDLQKEVSRQEVINKISSVQAKALQELAIARRIDTALEVEIEEFYEGSGDGGVGINVSPEALKAGIHGTGNKVTRRIYRFKDFRDNADDLYEQLLDEQNEENDKE